VEQEQEGDASPGCGLGKKRTPCERSGGIRIFAQRVQGEGRRLSGSYFHNGAYNQLFDPALYIYIYIYIYIL